VVFFGAEKGVISGKTGWKLPGERGAGEVFYRFKRGFFKKSWGRIPYPNTGGW
jgi:hypothetical protein